MDITLLSHEFDPLALIDTYESFIWTDRYNTPGDFELYSPVNVGMVGLIAVDMYLQIGESEHTMIVEKIEIKTDAEVGTHVTITGRSLESILDRRVIWGQLILSGSLQDGIRTMLEVCIINPTDPDRRIPNFIFEASDDPRITALNLEAQFYGDNLGEAIQSICSENDLGYKITRNANGQFVFKLYYGTDRSFSQDSVPFVIFSPSFENLLNTAYVIDNTEFKTMAFIGGEGEGSDKKTSSVGYSTYSGLDRREFYVDAGDVSSNDGEVSQEDYVSQLNQKGFEELIEKTPQIDFDGELDTTLSYKYGTDFFMGDIVQVENEYKMQGKCRVTEMIMSENEEGIKNYPTFSAIQ